MFSYFKKSKKKILISIFSCLIIPIASAPFILTSCSLNINNLMTISLDEQKYVNLSDNVPKHLFPWYSKKLGETYSKKWWNTLSYHD